MGCHASKAAKAAAPAAKTSNVRYTEELRSYLAECGNDNGTTVQMRAGRAISTLADGVEVRSLSFDSLKEVTGSLLEMKQEVVKVILDSKRDIWDTPDLFDLVELYFDNSLQTLDSCAVLQRCLKRATDPHVSLHHVDDKTLDELRHFTKSGGDPFTRQLFRVFQSAYRHQTSMLEKLQLRKARLDRKLRSVRRWRRISRVFFATAVAAVIVCSVVAAAVAAPPVAAALGAATSLPIGSLGKWLDSVWKGYEDALRGHKDVIGSMQAGTYVAISDLDSLRALIHRLEVRLGSTVKSADLAGSYEARVAVEEIMKVVGGFANELGERADRCSLDIRRARSVVLHHVLGQPDEHDSAAT